MESFQYHAWQGIIQPITNSEEKIYSESFLLSLKA